MPALNRTRSTPHWLRRALAIGLGTLIVGLSFGGTRGTTEPRAAAAPRARDDAARHSGVVPRIGPSAAAGNKEPPDRLGPTPRLGEPAGGQGNAVGAPPTLVEAATACPTNMVLVAGNYCSSVEHTCRRWLDDPKLPFARCADYEPTSRCTGLRRSLRFCIDRYEYTPPSAELPLGGASFVVAARTCGQLGKRVCTEDEWNFACEGEEMRPYPYGFSRAPVCNQDRPDLYEPGARKQVLKDWRQASGSLPGCKSPFGVYDMVGNLDEPVLRESQREAYPFRNALKGGWWMAARNRCRPATTAHDDHYTGIQVGIRCCRAALSG